MKISGKLKHESNSVDLNYDNNGNYIYSYCMQCSMWLVATRKDTAGAGVAVAVGS